jgi:hypothetical protein
MAALCGTVSFTTALANTSDYMSLVEPSGTRNRRQEIDIGGLEVGRMSELGNNKAGSAEILHFFRGFSIFCRNFEGCFSHCKGGGVWLW